MDTLLAGVQQLLDVFMAKGYALKATLTPDPGSPNSFTVRLQGPASLWSQQVSALRQDAAGLSQLLTV